MSTDYYLRMNWCKCCQRGDEIPIGRASAGWYFALIVHPQINVRTLNDWIVLFRDRRHQIVDSSGRYLSADQMIAQITNRSAETEFTLNRPHTWWALNSCEPGDYGLVRHRIDAHCLGHGSGTWSYFRSN